MLLAKNARKRPPGGYGETMELINEKWAPGWLDFVKGMKGYPVWGLL